MQVNTEFLIELYLKHQNITRAAREYCSQLDLEYSDSFRRRCSKIINREIDLSEVEEDSYAVSPLSALKDDGTLMSIEEYCKYYKIPLEDVRSYKLVTHTGKGAYYNISSNPVQTKGFEDFCDKLLNQISEISTRPSIIERVESVEEGHLLIVDPADVHIGKIASSFETGEEYNNQIAVQRVREGIRGIISKSKGFNIEKILFIGGNDILHIDTPKRTTTSGTPQDTDDMWYNNFLLAKDVYIETIDYLLSVADVHFVFNPSNHDYMSGFFLADVIKTYYKDCPNITFDCSMAHRKYYRYGNNLIGTTHGDGAKQADLPLLMAHESQDWSQCKHKYIYGHHVHHKIAKDYIGVTFETLRSPSGSDSWHYRNGYVGVPKAIEGFVHHPEFGQVARLTHIF